MDVTVLLRLGMLWEESIGVEVGLSKYITCEAAPWVREAILWISEAIPKEHRDHVNEAEEAAVLWTVK